MALAHYPECSIQPPLRCYQWVGGPSGGFCAKDAAWLRAGSQLFEDAYFCHEHCAPSDVSIPSPVIVNRVRLTVQVLFAGVSPRPDLARAEAVARLEAAVQSAGGLVTVDGATSCLVRYGALSAPFKGDGAGGRR